MRSPNLFLKKEKSLAVMLAIVMFFSIFVGTFSGSTANADTTKEINNGNLYITASGSYILPASTNELKGKTIYINSNLEVKITGLSNNTYSEVSISAAENTKLTIQNVNITNGNTKSAFAFLGGSNQLILEGNNHLYHTGSNYPVIYVPGSSTLNMSQSSSGGTLYGMNVATPGNSSGYGSVIGGGHRDDVGSNTVGNIVINSGKYVLASENGAALCGPNRAGSGTSKDFTTGTVTINGGDIVIFQNSKAEGAGLGDGGRQGSHGPFVINDGNLSIYSEGYGAGIGSAGSHGTGAHGTGVTDRIVDGGQITINGGIVNAINVNPYGGAGIGSGGYYYPDETGRGQVGDGDGGIIKINGGNVFAYSKGGKRIGAGYKSGGKPYYTHTLKDKTNSDVYELIIDKTKLNTSAGNTIKVNGSIYYTGRVSNYADHLSSSNLSDFINRAGMKMSALSNLRSEYAQDSIYLYLPASGNTVHSLDINGTAYKATYDSTKKNFTLSLSSGNEIENPGGETENPGTDPETPGTGTAQSYTVSFNGNGSTASPQSKTLKNGESYGTMPKISRTGYIFKGWYTSTSGGKRITENDIVKLTDNQMLYAQWTPKSIGTIFDGNGGKLGSSTYKAVIQTYGNSFVLPNRPKRSNYQFKGWYTAKNKGKQITSKTKVSIMQTTRYYASWTGSNNYLKKISVSNGKLNTSFKKTRKKYTVKLKKNQSSLKLTAAKVQSTTAIKMKVGNGKYKTTKSTYVKVNKGKSKTTYIKVTAQNGTSRIYAVKVSRSK